MTTEEMLKELLEIEERNKIFYLTSSERRQFQYEVEEMLTLWAERKEK